MPAPQTSRTLPVPSARPRRIAVVGGGISGLSAAWAAHRADPGAEIVVLEAGAQLGGCLRHTDLGGWAGAGADAGAEASLAVRPEVRGLAAELGLEPVFPDPAQASQLYLDGAMHPMPQGTLMGVPGDPEALRGLLPAADVERVGAEVLTAPVAGDTAVGEFLAARLGDAVVDRVIDPLVGGVYAGRCRELSLAATVPALLPAAREGTSVLEAVRAVRAERSAARGANVPGTQAAHAAPVFLSFRGGISALVPALEAALRAAGVRVRTGTRVEALAPRPERRGRAGRPGGWELALRAEGARRGSLAFGGAHEALRVDDVVLAVPAHAAAPLLSGAAESAEPTAAAGEPSTAAGVHAAALAAAAHRLAAVPYADSALVTAVLRTRGELRGSGFLVPPVEETFIKASTYASNKWPWLAAELPAGHAVVRMSIGRHGDAHWQRLPDAELAERALADWMAITGRADTVVHTEVQRWTAALPQYAPGHLEAAADLDAVLGSVPGLALAGSALDGVGIPACIARARTAVGRLLRPARSTSPHVEHHQPKE